jgi:hypothetical protein
MKSKKLKRNIKSIIIKTKIKLKKILKTNNYKTKRIKRKLKNQLIIKIINRQKRIRNRKII